MSICWIGVYAKPQAEIRTAAGIVAARLGAFLPLERMRIRQRDGDRYVVIKPLFPRYLFAKCDPGRIDKILEVDGVQDVLRCQGRLQRMPDEIVTEIQRAQENGAFDRAENGLRDGDEVRIVAGPFAGLIARVRSARSRDRMQIVVDFIHTMTVPVDNLKRIASDG